MAKKRSKQDLEHKNRLKVLEAIIGKTVLKLSLYFTPKELKKINSFIGELGDELEEMNG